MEEEFKCESGMIKLEVSLVIIREGFSVIFCSMCVHEVSRKSCSEFGFRCVSSLHSNFHTEWE